MGLYADELAEAQKASRPAPPAPYQGGSGRAGSSPVSTPRGQGGRPSRGSFDMDNGEEQTNTVFVGSIAPDTDDRALRDFFNQFGRVLETKVVYDIETGRSRGFGFVKFDDPRDAGDAINDADGKVLDGRNIKCNIAKYPRGGGAGFRGGGRGGRGEFRGRGRGPPPGGRFGPRRSRSPGRYSPGRYSPGRYSAGHSDYSYSSRSGSRTPSQGGRSRSPPRKRGRGNARSPGGKRRRRRAASYSSGSGSYTGSGSSTSGSFSTTGSEGSRSPPPARRRTGSRGNPAQMPPAAALPAAVAPQELAPIPVLAPPIPVAQAVAPVQQQLSSAPSDALKQELVEGKRREEQMQTRIVALEGEVQKSRASYNELESSVTALATHLQASEESRKQYRKWLSAFTECAKALSDSRESLRKAEEQVKERSDDMDKFVMGVKVFLSKEKSTRRARRDKERTSRRVADEAVVDGGAGIAAVGISGAADFAGSTAVEAASLDINGIKPDPVDVKGGGWAERMDVDAPDALQDAEAIANKFKPGIKFKLTT